MLLSIILSLVSVILLSVSLSVNLDKFIIGLYIIKTTTKLEVAGTQVVTEQKLSRGIYKMQTKTKNIEGMKPEETEKIKCSDYDVDVDVDAELKKYAKKLKNYCNIIPKLPPILIGFNGLMFMLSCLIKMKVLKNTSGVSVLIKLLSIITICLNIVLIVIIIKDMNTLKSFLDKLSAFPENSTTKLHPDYVFYLICGSLAMSLASFIIYLRHPLLRRVKK